METRTPIKYRYQLFTSRVRMEELPEQDSFGLQLWEGDRLVDEIPDISADRDFVRDLARRFTRGQLAPVHFWDAVEDALE